MLSWPVNLFLGLLMMRQHPWSTEDAPADGGREITGLLLTGVHTLTLVDYFKESYFLFYEAHMFHAA